MTPSLAPLDLAALRRERARLIRAAKLAPHGFKLTLARQLKDATTRLLEAEIAAEKMQTRRAA